MRNEIGVRIGRLRESKGITQAELAAAVGVKRETVAQWETGARDIKTDSTVKLADYFGVTCDYLLRGVKAENVDIHKRIGLSDEAIASLEMFQENLTAPSFLKRTQIKNGASEIHIIERLLSLEEGRSFIFLITDAVNARLEHLMSIEKITHLFNVIPEFDTKEKPSELNEDLFEEHPELINAVHKIAKEQRESSTRAGAFAWEAQEMFYKMLDSLTNDFYDKIATGDAPDRADIDTKARGSNA